MDKIFKHYTQSTIVIQEQDTTIIIDPFKIVGKNLPKADILLISHTHGDHFSMQDIQEVITPQTAIITSHDIKFEDLSNTHKTILPNEKIEVENITIIGTPAYNTNKEFHPKENNWLGFHIQTPVSTYYFTGDCDDIEEFSNYSNADVAFIPVSGTYVMSADEAADATISKIKPKLAVPVHFGEVVGNKKDAEIFVEKVKKAGLEAEIRKEE